VYYLHFSVIGIFYHIESTIYSVLRQVKNWIYCVFTHCKNNKTNTRKGNPLYFLCIPTTAVCRKKQNSYLLADR